MARRTLSSIVTQPESTVHETRRHDSAGTTFDGGSLWPRKSCLGAPTARPHGTPRRLRAGSGQGGLEVRHGPGHDAKEHAGMSLGRAFQRKVFSLRMSFRRNVTADAVEIWGFGSPKAPFAPNPRSSVGPSRTGARANVECRRKTHEIHDAARSIFAEPPHRGYRGYAELTRE